MAIAYRGIGAIAFGTTSPKVPDIDATGYQADDVAILVGGDKKSSPAATIASTGYTFDTKILNTSGTPDVQAHSLYRLLTASESDPSVTCTDPGNTWGVFLIVYSGVHTITVFDAVSTTGTGTATDTVAPSITTVTANAMVLSICVGESNNSAGLTLKAGSEQGFTARASGSAYDTDGAALCFGIAEKAVASPGAVTGPTWTVTGSVNKALITVALRPAGTVSGEARRHMPRGVDRGLQRGVT